MTRYSTPVRGHNEGSLYERPDGRYTARVSLPDGRRISRLCPHRHQPGAQPCREARDLLRDLKRRRDEGSAPVGAMTLGAYLRRWIEATRGDVEPATWRKREQHVRLHLDPRLGRIRLRDLSEDDVNAYLRGLTITRRDAEGSPVQVPADPRTRAHHRATLRLALRGAERFLHYNAAASSRPVEVKKPERPVLTAEQARTLIDGTREWQAAAIHEGPCSTDGETPCKLEHRVERDRLHALWVLLATTGLREAEALALTWEDVAADSVTVRRTLHRIDGEWQLRRTKTAKSERTVYLPPVTAEALADHRRAQLAEWLAAGRPGELGLVFLTPAGRPLHGANLAKALRAHTTRLGLPDVTPHGLRHSAATILYGAGVPLEAVADMLGHSTVRVTQDLYRHRVEQVQREAATKMQEALG